jgi:hypothetical protein
MLGAVPARAGDLPANDAGTRTISEFLAAYAGKATLPTIKVTPQGAGYLVAFDIGAATASLRSAGFAYDKAELKFRVFQQDDGRWRVELAEMPPLKGHMTPPKEQSGGQIDVEIAIQNFKSSYLIDPKLNWIDAIKGEAEKTTVVERGPGIEEFFELGKIKADGKTTSAATGLTTTINEPIGTFDLVMDVDPKGVDPNTKGPAKPTHVSAKGAGGAVVIAMKDFQPQPLLDVWKFMVAHPERADYARDVDALKSVVKSAIADRLTLDEQVSLDTLGFSTEAGPVALEGIGLGFTAVSNGAESGFGEHLSAKTLRLPDGLVPPVFAAVTPTAFDVGFKASGFDVAAAADEWFANANFAGDGPVVSAADQSKVTAKLTQSRPIVVDILPSHVAAPSLDIAFEGKVTIEKGKPTGSITLKMRDFDKTAKALQALGPEAEQKLVPVLAMAKGLGKTQPDGAMVWVGEVGKDQVMKVNGLPLGKSPL